jgi:hypothetical protein
MQASHTRPQLHRQATHQRSGPYSSARQWGSSMDGRRPSGTDSEPWPGTRSARLRQQELAIVMSGSGWLCWRCCGGTAGWLR